VALPDDERNQRDGGDRHEPEGQCRLVRHRREVDGEDQRRDERDRDHTAEVVDRVRRLVDVRRHVADGHREGHEHQRQRDDEDRAPLELLEQRAGDDRAERRDRAAERGPEGDRLRPARPGPQRGDQRERRRIRHARRDAAEDARGEQHGVARGERRQDARGDGEREAEQQHQLAPVAVAQRAEVEHRGRQAERVPDRDQVEHRLRGVEVLPDVGQRDVGHRQIEVGDARDEDQRGEHHRGPGRCLLGSVARHIA
jgi:hypothetical protein